MAEHNVTLELFYDGGWHPAPVLTRFPIKAMRGTKSVGNDTDPALATATIDNDSEMYAPRSVASPLHGKIGQNTKGRLSADGAIRLSGEVASWKPQRPIKGSGWTPIELAGVLRRIGRGTDPIQSALTRATLALSPRAFWPLEGGGGALTDGTPPMLETGDISVTWNDQTSATPGSLPGAKFGNLTTTGNVQYAGLVADARGQSASAWSIGGWFIAERRDDNVSGDSNAYLLYWRGSAVTSATSRNWFIRMQAGAGWTGVFDVLCGFDSKLRVYLPTATTPFDGQPHHFVVVAEQTAPTEITTTLYFDGVAYTSPTFDGNPAVGFTQTPVSEVRVGGGVTDTDATHDPQLRMVGVALFDRALTGTEVTKLYVAGLGHEGETASDRFVRFCAEEGIPTVVIGSESLAMGPQRPVTRLEILDEIARTDDASIFETKDDVGLTMRTGSSRMNQAPDLTIYYNGDIVPDLIPVYGDEGIRNDVTARDPSGATRRVQQLTGPHNVQLPEDDPQGVGRYQTSTDVNPETEDALSDAAGWRVNLGTYDGTWYAEVTVDLDAAPRLITAVNALDIGDVLAIANLPADEALDTVEGVIIGIEEDLPPKRRLVTFYLVPAAPYRVGILALTSGDTDPFLGHLDGDGSTTATSVAVGAASFTVATPSGPLWTVDADDFPFDVLVGGQRVSLSAISGGSSPQTFTVRTAGFQVRYAVASGSEVKPYQPIILAP